MITKGQEFKVLDHGYIRVIDWMGTDESIIEAARMSTGKMFTDWDPYEKCEKCGAVEKSDGSMFIPTSREVPKSTLTPPLCKHEWKKQPGDANLLDYLWRHLHTSPFEFCELHIEVNAPILVWRQWHRHRTQSYNEASARYAKMSSDHYLPTADRFKPKVTSNKQESSAKGASQISEEEDWMAAAEVEQMNGYAHYEAMVDAGVPNEIARINSPVSRYSKCRVKTDLKNWFGFLALRMEAHAQWEIRQYANVIGDKIIAELFPRAWYVFVEHTLHGTRFSRTEMSIIQDILLAWSQNMPSTDILREQAMVSGLQGSVLEEFLSKVKKAGQAVGG